MFTGIRTHRDLQVSYKSLSAVTIVNLLYCTSTCKPSSVPRALPYRIQKETKPTTPTGHKTQPNTSILRCSSLSYQTGSGPVPQKPSFESVDQSRRGNESMHGPTPYLHLSPILPKKNKRAVLSYNLVQRANKAFARLNLCSWGVFFVLFYLAVRIHSL